MGEEDNASGYFQKNNDDRHEDKDENSGDDTIFVDNLVWENTDNDIVIQDIPYHYCGPFGLNEGMYTLFKTDIGCILITSVMLLEYFHWVTAQSKKISWLHSFGDKFGGLK